MYNCLLIHQILCSLRDDFQMQAEFQIGLFFFPMHYTMTMHYTMQDYYSPGLCYYGMLMPLLFPVAVGVVYCNRLGLKFFIHN